VLESEEWARQRARQLVRGQRMTNLVASRPTAEARAAARAPSRGAARSGIPLFLLAVVVVSVCRATASSSSASSASSGAARLGVAARGRTLLDGAPLRHEGHPVLRRLRPDGLVAPARRDRVGLQGHPGRRLREDRRDDPARGGRAGRRGPLSSGSSRGSSAWSCWPPAPPSHFIIAILLVLLSAWHRQGRSSSTPASGRCRPCVPAAFDKTCDGPGPRLPALPRAAGLQQGDVVLSGRRTASRSRTPWSSCGPCATPRGRALPITSSATASSATSTVTGRWPCSGPCCRPTPRSASGWRRWAPRQSPIEFQPGHRAAWVRSRRSATASTRCS
jgi:hypothetical protein